MKRILASDQFEAGICNRGDPTLTPVSLFQDPKVAESRVLRRPQDFLLIHLRELEYRNYEQAQNCCDDFGISYDNIVERGSSFGVTVIEAYEPVYEYTISVPVQKNYGGGSYEIYQATYKISFDCDETADDRRLRIRNRVQSDYGTNSFPLMKKATYDNKKV